MTADLHPQGSLTFLPQLEHRIDSLYAALDTLLVTGQFETAFHLAGSLYPYWETYENLTEGVGWLRKLLDEEAGDRLSRASLSGLYAMLGNLLRHQGEYGQAADSYELGLACLEHQPDHKVHTFILGGLGEIAFRQGRYEAAAGFYRSYLEIGRQVGDDRYVANAFNALGRLATVKGDVSEALEYHQQGQHLCQAKDYPTGLAWMFNALGELERSRAHYREAAEHFRESAAIFDRLGNAGAQMLALQNLAFALLPDDASASEKLLQKTLGFWMRGPARHGMSLSLIGLSRVEIARGNMKKAVHQISAASQVLGQIGVQLELGDRVDFEIAMEKIKRSTGHEPLPGKQEIDGPASAELAGASSSRNVPRGTALTHRERAVLRLAARGLTDKQIAAQLVISPHTVNAHLKSIYRKLSVNNRTAAVARSRHIL